MPMRMHANHSSGCLWTMGIYLLTSLALFSFHPNTSSSFMVMAVDRSKFRTCGETSFCRRNRFSPQSKPNRGYHIVKDTVRLFLPGDEPQLDTEDVKAEEASGSGSGLWKSLFGAKEKGANDPHVRGPAPILTALLSSKTSQNLLSGPEEDLLLTLHLHSNGVSRLRITENYNVKNGNQPHNSSPRTTFDELVLEENMQGVGVEGVEPLSLIQLQTLVGDATEETVMGFRYGSSKAVLVLQLNPFQLSLYDSMEASGPVVTVNSKSMMHFEQRMDKNATPPPAEQVAREAQETDVDGETNKVADRHGGKEITGYWEDGLAIYADGTREEKIAVTTEEDDDDDDETNSDRVEIKDQGLWEEKFHSHTDSKPNGPTSVGLDIHFASTHLFGLPEHASSTVLKPTLGDDAHYTEPYRLYNLDVFEFELDETMALYGSVPFIVSHTKAGTAGVFYFNPSETFVDILSNDNDNKEAAGTTTHWISESGILDLFLLPGPSVSEVYKQYASLTGKLEMMPMFALGYHQCRWNYKDERDVLQVHAKFEELDYPYDVLWLDIEHTNGKRYFTWDKGLFPNPISMQNTLSDQGRKMVTIIDPHMKRDDHYHIHKEATKKGLYVRDKTGTKDFDGWCWPGSSSYLDFTDAGVRDWWASQFAFDTYEGSTPSLYVWNDMNEPSVFNGPEVSMQKDLLNLKGVEHREWHNIYGMLFQRATAEGLVMRHAEKNERPFVLSRAFFAGSQKYGAIWTGDNTATWEHLQSTAPMLLSLNIGALSFVGADVGGFFGNPNAELMTRWMQAGAYQPFFRGHAHHDSQRREPWMFGEETLHRLRRSAIARYALLPYFYTLFHEASTTGMPVMRPLWMQYPTEEILFPIDDEWLIGSDLLIKPVVEPGVTKMKVLFPPADRWYDVDTMERMPSTTVEIPELVVDCPLDKIPVYQRGGSIIPRKLRLRRSTQMMIADPYTLFVALDGNGRATGRMYTDDEHSFDHKSGRYASALLEMATGQLSNSVSHQGLTELDSSVNPGMIERIVIMGFETEPSSAILTTTGAKLQFLYEQDANVLVVRKPNVSMLDNWSIQFQ
mmetsp:Transcript_52531/g.63315  ORF Transcript_52531/g.63315 Transcript_52531/m.63315 type:complete len:1073 (+) Transcript_52531:78-3296(+)